MDKLDITHLVPNFLLGDKNGWAMAKAIETAMQIFFEKVDEAVGAALDPDRMPEWRLDELARDENLFWYNPEADLDVKREIIKSARRTYAALGTLAGTESAAQDYAADARIEEWHEYGGEPAHFRIRSRSDNAVRNASAIAEAVNGVKRLGAVLEGICIDCVPAEVRIHAGTALYHGVRSVFAMEEATPDAWDMNVLTDEQDNTMLDEIGLVLFEQEGTV